jgi:hypothetical protein
MARAYVMGGALAVASVLALAFAPGIHKAEQIRPPKSETVQQALEPIPARIFSTVVTDRPPRLGPKADALVWPEVKMPLRKPKVDSGVKPRHAKAKHQKSYSSHPSKSQG